MEGYLITIDGGTRDVDAAALRSLISSSTRFWLDVSDLSHEDVQWLLRDTFGFHPLAVEDAEHFHQRPKVDYYDGCVLMVLYGASEAGELVEVHCFYTATYLVTVHQGPVRSLSQLSDRLRRHINPAHDHVMVLYRVADALVDGFFPVLGGLDDDIDDLEDQILERPTEQQLGRLFDMKRSLIAMRKVVTPERDMFASLLSADESLPGMTPDAERYFRDLYDHLIRISDLVDSYRDLLSGALDTHLSTVSNRLNAVMKQLTIIATVFLPLSFLTGFFGQNFAWMVNRIGSFPAFAVLGIGLQLVIAGLLFGLFKQRGWLTAEGAAPSAKKSKRSRLSRDRRWHVVRPALAPAEADLGPRSQS